MLKKLVLSAVAISLLLVVVACSSPTSIPATGQVPAPKPAPSPSSNPSPPTTQNQASTQTVNPGPKPSGLIKAIWIEPKIDGDKLSLPLSAVEQNWNTHFKAGNMNFMAYIVDGEIKVRANVCPPCKSIGFSLDDDILVCDRCQTTFEARTGDGIEGACVNYPKESVPYEIIDGQMVMTESDCVSAYEGTVAEF